MGVKALKGNAQNGEKWDWLVVALPLGWFSLMPLANSVLEG